MIELLRTWLLGLTTASLILALAETLVAQKGIRQVLRLTGGILLMIVLVQPLLRIDLEDLMLPPEDWDRQIEALTEDYRREGEDALAAGIEEELASYIWDKAKQLGLDCQVTVTVKTDADGVPIPERVAVTGPYSRELSELIAAELGIPAEKQDWQEAA